MLGFFSVANAKQKPCKGLPPTSQLSAEQRGRGRVGCPSGVPMGSRRRCDSPPPQAKPAAQQGQQLSTFLYREICILSNLLSKAQVTGVNQPSASQAPRSRFQRRLPPFACIIRCVRWLMRSPSEVGSEEAEGERSGLSRRRCS